MKARILLLIAALCLPAKADFRPYQHPEGSAAYYAANEYTNRVRYLHSQWQAMRISKQQFIGGRNAAWNKYMAIAFPAPEPEADPYYDIKQRIQELEMEQRAAEYREFQERVRQDQSGNWREKKGYYQR